ncbi:hypothetical protein N9L06_00885, partial [Mariniblastus sp.]|nr:hypothetical protein [Mariniblastus sp.]
LDEVLSGGEPELIAQPDMSHFAFQLPLSLSQRSAQVASYQFDYKIFRRACPSGANKWQATSLIIKSSVGLVPDGDTSGSYQTAARHSPPFSPELPLAIPRKMGDDR